MTADRVVVAGASGFIGRSLVRELAGEGRSIIALSMDPDAARRRLPETVSVVRWDGRTAGDWARFVEGARAVVNLSGDSLAKGRWTKAKKARILDSRTRSGAALVEAVRRASVRPGVFVQASAVGFYGSSGEAEVDEASPQGEGFLAEVVRQWEASSREVEALGVRRVVTRSGLVLGRGGGVWPSLARPIRLFAGGPLGSGRQWSSWIGIQDEVRAMRFLIAREDLAGTFNLTAPCPLRQRELCRIAARALRRPCWIPVPAFVLRLLFGEKAGQTLLVSQRVIPRRLEAAGFVFHDPDAAAAVTALVRSGSRGGSA
jgi:uncharacterized protein (TIGR01777 family)